MLADTLRYLDNRVEIRARAVPAAASGRPRSAWELSVRRALAVADALRGAGYLPEVTALGLGTSQGSPRGPAGVPEEGRSVDIIIRETHANGGGRDG